MNKKKQKNFELLAMGCGGVNAHVPKFQKFFGSPDQVWGRHFLQKRTCE